LQATRIQIYHQTRERPNESKEKSVDIVSGNHGRCSRSRGYENSSLPGPQGRASEPPAASAVPGVEGGAEEGGVKKGRIQKPGVRSQEERLEKIRAASRAYYKTHREEKLAYAHSYYKRNSEKIKKYVRSWIKENPIRNAANNRAWNLANPIKRKSISRAYYNSHLSSERNRSRLYAKANPEKGRNRSRVYYKAHPEKAQERHRAWLKAHPEKATVSACVTRIKRRYGRNLPQALIQLKLLILEIQKCSKPKNKGARK